MFNMFPSKVTGKHSLLGQYILITIAKRNLLFLCLPPSQLFSDVAYKARDREDLIAGIDEFLDEVIVLPPGEWDPKIRIEPPKKVPSADKRLGISNRLGNTCKGQKAVVEL